LPILRVLERKEHAPVVTTSKDHILRASSSSPLLCRAQFDVNRKVMLKFILNR